MPKPWKIMLDNGLTTFAERPEPSRSDCHAWSSSPLYHFLSLICGIRSASPGFKKVEIAPNPGDLTWFKGKMHHLNGEIIVDLKQGKKQSLSGKVVLPPGLSGTFIWKNNLLNLEEGTTELNF